MRVIRAWLLDLLKVFVDHVVQGGVMVPHFRECYAERKKLLLVQLCDGAAVVGDVGVLSNLVGMEGGGGYKI